MSSKRLINALVRLGVSQTEVRVYMHLATKGPQDSEKIAETLRMQNNLIRIALENLVSKGIVCFSSKQSTTFSALSIDEAINVLIMANISETLKMEQSKAEILSKWETIKKNR